MRRSILLFLALTTSYYATVSANLSKVDKALSVFDLDFDDLVVEQGENWVERYYIK